VDDEVLPLAEERFPRQDNDEEAVRMFSLMIQQVLFLPQALLLASIGFCEEDLPEELYTSEEEEEDLPEELCRMFSEEEEDLVAQGFPINVVLSSY
jgi:hypothetical protein